MRFDVSFRETNTRIDCKLKNELAFDVKFENFTGITEVETYDGNYDVIPKTEGQTLETNQKYMKSDVTIQKIPFYNVSNESGGSTVYIGSEV